MHPWLTDAEAILEEVRRTMRMSVEARILALSELYDLSQEFLRMSPDPKAVERFYRDEEEQERQALLGESASPSHGLR